jgi:hypothetical protein
LTVPIVGVFFFLARFFFFFRFVDDGVETSNSRRKSRETRRVRRWICRFS